MLSIIESSSLGFGRLLGQTQVFSQAVGNPNNPTQQFLNNSQQIALESYVIWNRIWDDFFDSGLWTGLVVVALFIAGFSFIAVAFQWLPDLTSQAFDGRRAFRMFFPVIAITILLQGNAELLEQFLRIVRQIAVYFVNLPLKLQLLNVTLAEAITALSQQNALFGLIAQILGSCDGNLANEYEQCLRNGIAQARILGGIDDLINSGGAGATIGQRASDFLDTILSAIDQANQSGSFATIDGLGGNPIGANLPDGFMPPPDFTINGIDIDGLGTNPLTGNRVDPTTGADIPNSTDADIFSALSGDPTSLQQVTDGVNVTNLLNPVSLITGNTNGAAPDFLAFFSAVQFAFVQGLEMVLLGAFAIFPVIVALLMTAQGGQAMTTWVGSIAGLYATQLIYNIMVGVISGFLFEMDFAATTRVSDLSFKVFISIIAPLIALNLGYGQFARAVGGALSTARFLGNGNGNPGGSSRCSTSISREINLMLRDMKPMNVLKQSSLTLGFVALTLSLAAKSVHPQVYIPVPAPRDYYAAFAISFSEGYWGAGWRSSSRAEAKAEALRSCTEVGVTDCKIVLSWRNACATFATASNGVVGYALKPVYNDDGTATTRPNVARKHCESRGGIDCVVKKTICARG